MDENKFLEKMRLLKLQETIRIVESKVGLQADKREWEQALSENKVSNVKYMGKTEIDGKWQDIYMVVEQFQKEINGKVNIVDVEKYVTENLEYIAGDNKQDGYSQIFLSEKYSNQKELLEQLQNMDENGILDLSDLENQRIENIAKELNIEPEDIYSIDEIDLEQLIDEKYSELNSERENQEELLEKGSSAKKGIGVADGEKDDRVKLSEKQLDGLQIKEETSLSQDIKGVTLSEKLGCKKMVFMMQKN